MSASVASASTAVVVAVVVTYRRHAVVQQTIEGLARQPRLTAIVLVDNGNDLPVLESPVESVALVVVPNADNTGFGAALALGMRHAREAFDPDFYWLLDDDSPPSPDALDGSLDVALRLPDLGSLNTRAGSYRRGRITHLAPNPSDTPRAVDWTLVDGALIPRRAIELAGLPREDLFMMLEDFEYTTRISAAGLTNYQRSGVLSDPQHLGSAGSWRHYYQSRNLLRIAIDRRSPVAVVGWFFRECRIQAMLLYRRRPKVVLLRWRGALDAVLGRMGRQVEPS